MFLHFCCLNQSASDKKLISPGPLQNHGRNIFPDVVNPNKVLVNDVTRWVLCPWEACRFESLVGWCGRSKADLSFIQNQALIRWLKATMDGFLMNCWNGMCLKGGEDVWWWMMRKFCHGIGEVLLSRMLIKCNYSYCNPKGFWQNLWKVIVLWMVLKYRIYVNINELMLSYWNKILQMYCGIYINECVI